MSLVYSKILLFGEYSIMKGSTALTIPFTKYSATLDWPKGGIPTNLQKDSNKTLYKFINYLESAMSEFTLKINFERIYHDLKKGLYLNSTIPHRYGLGSSGSLVAAVFKKYIYQLESFSIDEQKEVFAHAESFFHGMSSGVDPLTCYYNNAVLCQENKTIILKRNPLISHIGNWWLYDTLIPSPTASYMDIFLKNFEDKIYQKRFQEYITMVNKAVHHLVVGSFETTYLQVQDISKFQLEFFSEMIPKSIQSIWRDGLASGDYCFKLCGSGGGGNMLVFTKYRDMGVESFPGGRLTPIS